MNSWEAPRVAAAAGARLAFVASETPSTGPQGASVDTRSLRAGELFAGLAGEHLDGGAHAPAALRAGAWGVLVAPAHEQAALAAASESGGAVLVHEHPLAALQALAGTWRAELQAHGARVIGITGSTGKTSTKDILAALLATQLRVSATEANLNTEIGLPLTLLRAPAGTRAVVLEMAMRGPGQIAELTAIAHPDVGAIVNVGPAHLELLGSLEAIAAAKAELIAGLQAGASAVLPAGEPLLAPHLREDVQTITFGEDGDVRLLERRPDGTVVIAHGQTPIELRPSFVQAHNLHNLLAAVAVMRALGLTPHGRLEVSFSAMRGQHEELPGGVTLIDDCYNANPMSMRAAIDELAASACARRVAVLGDMLELGVQAERLHRELGAYAGEHGVELLVAVGPLAAHIADAFVGESHLASDATHAAELLPGLLREGDAVLLKGSRGVGLERVASQLRDGRSFTAEAAAGRR